MAKIVRFHRIGGPEVLKIEEVPSREPGKGEAKLRVQAIGLNRAESMFMHGNYLEPTQLPASLGFEAAGVITEVGSDVDPGWLNKSVSTIPVFSLNQYDVVGDDSLERWAHSSVHADWWRLFVQKASGYGLWHET